MKHTWRSTAVPVFALVGVIAGIACSSPISGAVTVVDGPDPAAFATSVGPMLMKSCGTLDCHGQVGRNMRLYGNEGQRLDSTDVPGGSNTTTLEFDSDYHAVVGLEPELMTEVVANGGANPDSLTMVRKARGIEAHKGGKVWNEGDDRDVCLISWLSGSVNAAACTASLDYTKYP